MGVIVLAVDGSKRILTCAHNVNRAIEPSRQIQEIGLPPTESEIKIRLKGAREFRVTRLLPETWGFNDLNQYHPGSDLCLLECPEFGSTVVPAVVLLPSIGIKTLVVKCWGRTRDAPSGTYVNLKREGATDNGLSNLKTIGGDVLAGGFSGTAVRPKWAGRFTDGVVIRAVRGQNDVYTVDSDRIAELYPDLRTTSLLRLSVELIGVAAAACMIWLIGYWQLSIWPRPWGRPAFDGSFANFQDVLKETDGKPWKLYSRIKEIRDAPIVPSRADDLSVNFLHNDATLIVPQSMPTTMLRGITSVTISNHVLSPESLQKMEVTITDATLEDMTVEVTEQQREPEVAQLFLGDWRIEFSDPIDLRWTERITLHSGQLVNSRKLITNASLSTKFVHVSGADAQAFLSYAFEQNANHFVHIKYIITAPFRKHPTRNQAVLIQDFGNQSLYTSNETASNVAGRDNYSLWIKSTAPANQKMILEEAPSSMAE